MGLGGKGPSRLSPPGGWVMPQARTLIWRVGWVRWLATSFAERLGLRYPIVQAPMAGLGVGISSGRDAAAWELRAAIREVRSLSAASIG
jgi:hypothetical protein